MAYDRNAGTAPPDRHPQQPAEPGVSPLLAGLCDDAALFPPGNAPVADAVPAHRRHRRAWYAELVGPFLVGADRITEVGAAVAAADATPDGDPDVVGLDVVLVVREGPAALPAALRAAARQPALRVVGVELASDAAGTSAEAAARASAALADVPGVVELRRGPGLDAALNVLTGSPHRAKLRTGGLEPAAFPSVAELAGFLVGCATRQLGFKCTAGLHHAVRHTDPATGFTHHGFLNILVATHVAAEGADPEAVAEVLSERSGEALASVAAQLTLRQARRARDLFTAYGTCSIAEPIDDLTALGLLPAVR
ncbi:hypothetical protein ABIA33_006489 [Streptacidiphilus sp. MAP12-16]|uniref:hypothetical protein n=1 Tax=Streptacidiphilus sp. MAP12-16 TaxID=3156300 RepID=UPI003516DE1E